MAPESSHRGQRTVPAPRFVAAVVAVVAVVGFCLGGASAVADEAFLRIEAITISASDVNYDGWINLLAFGDGSVRGPLASASAGGATATPPKITDMTIQKQVDAASPKLMEYCATGKHLPKAQIDFVRTGGGPVYAVIELENVLISSYSFSGSSGGDDMPTESVSLNFTKIKLDVVDRGMTHLWETTFDVVTGKIGFSVTPLAGSRPTIESIGTQLGLAGAAFSFPVNIADPNTPVAGLTLSAESDNPALLPAGAFSFSGSGNTRQVTVTPAAGATGLAQTSITVSDGTASSTAYFLIVVSDDQGPDILLSPGDVLEHAAAGTTVGFLDAQPPSPLGPPTFEMLDSAAGRFRLEGSSLVVNDPFLLDFETAPRPVIVVRARDAAGNVSRAVAITVVVNDVSEGPFDVWRNTFFTPAELLLPEISGPYANPDGDLFNNLFEYALGLPPTNRDNGVDAEPYIEEVDIGGQKYLTLTFRRLTAAFDPNLVVEPDASGDLIHWGCGPEHFVLMSITPLPGNVEVVTVRSRQPMDVLIKQFIRLRILR